MPTEEEDLKLVEAVILRELGPTPFIDAPEATRNPLTLLNGLVAGYMPTPDQAKWLRRNFILGMAQVERMRLKLKELTDRPAP